MTHKIKYLENDVVIAWKPTEVSSFGFIKQLQKQNDWKKVGHAGTLDPLAEGLMIVGVNTGTKKIKGYVGLDKVYDTTVMLGQRTESGDMEGKVLEEKDVVVMPSKEKIQAVLSSLVGDILLPVPIFSAVKKNGKRLYKEARAGRDVKPPERIMPILGLELGEVRHDDMRGYVDVTMHVASGVYVRSVAEEIGRKLGYPAVVTKLIRTKIGEYSL